MPYDRDGVTKGSHVNNTGTRTTKTTPITSWFRWRSFWLRRTTTTKMYRHIHSIAIDWTNPTYWTIMPPNTHAPSQPARTETGLVSGWSTSMGITWKRKAMARNSPLRARR